MATNRNRTNGKLVLSARSGESEEVGLAGIQLKSVGAHPGSDVSEALTWVINEPFRVRCPARAIDLGFVGEQV
jgi:hypothetical protein